MKRLITISGSAKKLLRKLFREELRYLYWVEKNLTKALPKFMKESFSDELRVQLEHHLVESDLHIAKLERLFGFIRSRPASLHCKPVSQILQEGWKSLKQAPEGLIKDLLLVAVIRKAEHYELASYRSLDLYAEGMGLKPARPIISSIIVEEQQTVDRLGKLALQGISAMK